MKMKIITLITLFSVVLFGQSSGQQVKRCGTTEYMARMKAEDPTLAGRLQQLEVDIARITEERKNQRISDANAVLTIPVIFHVLYSTTTQNISQAKINDQLNTINKDYSRTNLDSNASNNVGFRSLAANTNIQFCMALRDPSGNALTEPGIKRVAVTASGFDPKSNNNAKYTSLGGDDAWPRAQYLNVWVVNFTGSSVDLLGISQFPGGTAATDGCCVLYKTVGGNTSQGTQLNYKLGRTLTHEVGHWLGLFHTWGDDDDQDGTCESASECGGTDYVLDTPNQGEENYSCPSFPHIDCCSSVTTTNNPGDPVNGVMFMNYMDYVNDNCMNMFTQGQNTRMHSALATASRNTLGTSNGCLAPTGLADLNALMLDVTVFPNPSSGIVTLSGQLMRYSDVTVNVANGIGEIVYTQELKNVLDIYLPIDLSAKAKGIYNLSIRSNDAVINKKIIVSH